MNEKTASVFAELFAAPDIVSNGIAGMIIVMAGFLFLKTYKRAWQQRSEDNNFDESDFMLVVIRALALVLFLTVLFQ